MCIRDRLSVLLYVGIRIVLSSTASDKAKYKQMLMDWVVELCIVFFLHYIMSFILTVTDMITEGIYSSYGMIVKINQEDGGTLEFKTNLTGDVYKRQQASSISDVIGGAQEFINSGIEDDSPAIDEDNLVDMSNMVYNALLVIATIIAVIVGLVISIQFKMCIRDSSNSKQTN